MFVLVVDSLTPAASSSRVPWYYKYHIKNKGASILLDKYSRDFVYSSLQLNDNKLIQVPYYAGLETRFAPLGGGFKRVLKCKRNLREAFVKSGYCGAGVSKRSPEK